MAVAFIAAVFCFCANAQEVEVDSSGTVFNDVSGDDSSFEDFGDLFTDETDTEEPVVTELPESGTTITFLSIPLKMSGELNAEVGGGLIFKEDIFSASAYFDLQNYLYFTTRPDKYMAVKGALKTSMPGSEEAEKDGQNHYFYLYELYFDYIIAGRVYLTAGKKKTVWGNVRLFSNDDDFDDDDALATNPLFDSRYNISGIIRVPFGKSSFTAVAMYGGGGDEPNYRGLSFAASLDTVFFNTYLNLFARTFPSKFGDCNESYKVPILGAEFKKTIFGVDVYAQGIARPESNEVLRQFWKKELYSDSAFERFTITAGFYKLWADKFPYFGINAEYQGIYYPDDVFSLKYDKKSKEWIEELDDDNEKKLKVEGGTFINKIAVDFGMAKLGKERNIKVGIQWHHDFTDKSGMVKPGVIISRIFPHCDWRNGLKYEYGPEYEKFGKLTLGTYLKFSLDY